VRLCAAAPRTRATISTVLTLFCAWLAPAPALAQRGALAGRPTLTAVRAQQPPNIDGRLDDDIWRSAALIDTLVQEEPQEGQPATEKTEIRVAYDSDRLYFGIYAHYSDISQRRANRSDRDKLDDDDSVTIYLEPFLDYLRGYSFAVNGYGVQRDSMIVVTNAQDNPDGDTSWNALFTSGGQLVDDGWTAEIAIPIKSLRYPGRKEGEAHRWGFQVRRRITSKDERAVWAPVSRSVMSFLAQIGILDGITNLSTERNFEVLPTFTAIGSGRLDPATAQFSSDHVEEGGVGLKFGLSSNLTLDFTYNPDFSQIESDNQQIQVNNRFPINFPELRPFFLEGREIYETPGNPRVETRRIVDPRYAAKLTGKVGPRTSVGILVADDEAPGKVDSVTDPAYGKTAKAVFGRLKYDLYRNSHVGLIVTDREFMNDYSRMVAGDLSLRIGQTRNFGFRYFRADNEKNGAAKTGWASTVSIRQEGRNWRWQNFTEAISPDFVNELSFTQRVDQIKSMPNLSYRFWPESWILNWGPSFAVPNTFDFDGVLQDLAYTPGVSFTFANNISFSGNYSRQMERFGQVDYDKNTWSVSGTVNSSRKISFTANYGDGDEILFKVPNPFLGRGRDYGTTVTYRPTARLQSVLRLSASRFRDERGAEGVKVFDVKIVRSTTTYQFTPRLLLRSISEFNQGLGADHTIFQNLLVTYRVNSGTVLYVGYDDRFRQGNAINDSVFIDTAYRRTNRAVFTKLQYLFRNGGET